MSSPKIKIMVGTPAYGGMCHVAYTSSLIHTIKHCASQGIEIEPCFLSNESLIPRARNTIVAKFMNDPSYTHLLFIDADVNWSPHSITRLVAHDKDIIGALYPKKGYDWQKLIKNKEVMKILNLASSENRELTDIEMGHIRTKLLSFVSNLRHKESKIQNGLVSLLHIGTGFMMIKRNVLEKMMDAYPDRKHDDDIGALSADENRYLYALFDCEIHPLSSKKHYLSEDYLFCKRWTDMGGEIFADITISLTHTGPHSFAGNFAVANNLTRSPSDSASVVPAPKPVIEEPPKAVVAVESPKPVIEEPPKALVAVESPKPVIEDSPKPDSIFPSLTTPTTGGQPIGTPEVYPTLKIERVPVTPAPGAPGPVSISSINDAKSVAPVKRLLPSQLAKIKIV